MKNFGKIKNAFNNILIEAIATKNKKDKLLFNQYVKTIKESEILRTEFLIYSNIENKLESNLNLINLFISENFKLLSKYKASDIIQENEKLIALSDKVKTKLTEPYDNNLTNLHESISSLIFIKKSPTTVNSVINEITKITDYILLNEAKVINESFNLPNSMLSGILIDKFNEKYGNLTESEKETIKSIFNANNEEKLGIYSKTIRECIDIIDTKLNDVDIDTKDKLLRVKDKLLNDKQDINENFDKNIIKLIDLRETLNFD